jgi:hypothetical protein
MKHSTFNIQHQTSNESGVEQASGLWFRASRPKRRWTNGCFGFPRSTCNSRHATKSGVTPDLTGVTPVPPAAFDVERSMFDVPKSMN